VYVIVWEFFVTENVRAQFEAHYGPRGTWAEFFRRGEGYLETELLSDVGVAGRYVTIDRWTSKDAYEAFRDRHHEEYEEMDRRFQPLTEREEQLGSFLTLKPESRVKA
jgi:heme-degrading monooxygenase HmoA